MAKVALVQGEEVKKPKVSLGTKIKKEWNRNKYVYALAIRECEENSVNLNSRTAFYDKINS